MDRGQSSVARTVPTVITGLIVGALFSAAAAGSRGYSFLFAFMLTSGFVIGIGLLVNAACERIFQAARNR